MIRVNWEICSELLWKKLYWGICLEGRLLRLLQWRARLDTSEMKNF